MKLARLTLLVAFLASAAHAGPLSFGLFGDTPYTHWERQHLPDLIAEMDREDLAFVIHDGDIKNGSEECSDATYRDILGVFRNSANPLVYVPGDNEWTDCHRRSNGGYDPLERLSKLRELFFSDEHALGTRKLRLERQSSDPSFSDYRENVRWEADGVLFVALNLPGSNNNFHGTGSAGPVPEFVARSAANRSWLARAFALARERKLAGLLIVIQANPDFHAANAGHPASGFTDFLDQLRRETLAFPGHVVLVHGDTHRYRVDVPMTHPETGLAVTNFTRVETFGSPAFGWVKGTVDATNPKVFSFEPRVFRRSVRQ